MPGASRTTSHGSGGTASRPASQSIGGPASRQNAFNPWRDIPGFPVNYPCEFQRSFNPNPFNPNPSNPSNPGNAHIEKGTRGEILQVNGDRTGAYVMMPYLRPQRGAWVPVSLLTIGSNRKYGDVEWRIKKILFNESGTVPNLPGDQLRNALNDMSISFRQNIDFMTWLPIWFKEGLRNDIQRRQLVDLIYNGVPSPVRAVLNRPNFSIRDLQQALAPIKPDDGKSIYTRIYFDFEDGRKPAQYIGKSISPYKRDLSHEVSEETETRSNHYQIARASRQMKSGIICYVENLHVLAAAEQFFVCLFQSYFEGVFWLTPPTPSSTTDNSVPDSEGSSRAAMYAQDKDYATTLANLANESFARSGWPGGRRRDSYGCGQGCNWNSPIVEMMSREATIWVKTSFPEANLDVFRRPPVRITDEPSRPKSFYIVMETAGRATDGMSRGKFTPTLEKDHAIKKGQWVYPVIEMTRNGQPHHLDWSRLPKHGPWEDWDKARSWALKIEYQDDFGQWKSFYCSAGLVLIPRKPWNLRENPGALLPYAQGIAIYRYLRQQTLDHYNRPGWLYDYGVAQVRQQKFDFLNQTWSIEELHPDDMDKAYHLSPKQTSFIIPELWRFGLQPVLRTVQGGFDDPDISDTRMPPGSCDSCYLQNVVARSADRYGNNIQRYSPIDRSVQCIPSSEDRALMRATPWNFPHKICERCEELGRICTWTRKAETLPLTDDLIQALLPRYRKEEIEFFEMADPQIQQLSNY